MVTVSSEYNIPKSAEVRHEASRLEADQILDTHTSKLDQLTANALGAATQTAAAIENAPPVSPEQSKQLSPSELLLQFGRQIVQLREAELAESAAGDGNE